MLNGAIKTSDRGEKHKVLGIFQRGYKELAQRVSTKPAGAPNANRGAMRVFQALSIVFSVIGVLTSLQWVWSVLVPNPRLNLILDHGSECLRGNLSRCPWAAAFSDLDQRLHALEIAFSEQTEARHYIEKGLYNQSALNSYLNGKLDLFLGQLENITKDCQQMEKRMARMSSRLLADEILGFLILICIAYEVYNRTEHWRGLAIEMFRHHVLKEERPTKEKPEPKETVEQPPELPVADCVDSTCPMSKPDGIVPACTPPQTSANFVKPHAEEERDKRFVSSNHSGPSTPKRDIPGFLRSEMCVVVFSRENTNLFSSVVDTLLGHMPDITLSSPAYYCIESTTDVMVVIGNDKESELLTGHRQYNSNLRLVFANDVMQDLASSGRVFSINREMSPHQMSHLRKAVKTLMNTRQKDTNSKPRFITITK
ncbi:hypothetical protein FSP39_021103 [Pinctada imbricata]|uniref:Uncharacterized protein n=1 Tax=Pinctada imbricata TaxID=66713 RepID=A0AA88XTR8_PINIB|nr:hypothetical protein FSP39_021103 [Pinctada imbricata]